MKQKTQSHNCSEASASKQTEDDMPGWYETEFMEDEYVDRYEPRDTEVTVVETIYDLPF
jgi:hypothetical protein